MTDRYEIFKLVVFGLLILAEQRTSRGRFAAAYGFALRGQTLGYGIRAGEGDPEKMAEDYVNYCYFGADAPYWLKNVRLGGDTTPVDSFSKS